MIRSLPDRQFERFRRTGDARALAKVFDATAPELWRVAVHLCRDRHAAEDAVQSAFLSAIESRDDWDASRPLLPWLLGHVANRVREQRRAAAREIDAARLERLGEPDPGAIAAANELGAVCRDALARLDEPYRSTLERHFVDGLAAHEIAADLGVPAGTVRMRLHRGLDALRQKLPVGLVGGSAIAAQLPPASRVAMREAVLRAVPGGAVVVGSGHVGSFTIGVLLMNKVIWGVAVSAVVVASLWWAWPSSGESTATNALAAVAPAAAEFESTTPPSANDQAVAAASSASTERTEVARAPAADAKGHVRFVLQNAATGAPVAGVDLELLDGLPRDPSLGGGTASSVSREDVRRTIRTQTGVDGTALVQLRPGFTSVHCPEFELRSSVEVAPGSAQERRIDLPVRIPVEVLVVDAEGIPTPGARLVGSTNLDASGLVAREFGQSDADGRFVAKFVETKVVLRAIHDAYSASPAVELDPGHPTATLRLGTAPATVAGMVFGPDGAPLANSLVALQPQPRIRSDVAPLVTKTDVRGRFECTNVPPGRCLVVAARLLDDGQSRLAMCEVEAIANERHSVEIRFDESAALDVRIAMADGAPVAGQTVMLSLQQENFSPSLARRGTAHLETDANGRGVLRGLLPGRYQVQFAHELGWVREYVDVARGEPTRYEHVFGARPGLDVRVVDLAGEPLAGWTVLITSGTEGHREVTDGGGRVRFVDLREETWRLSVRASDATAVAATQEVVPGTNVELRVDPAGAGQATVRGVLEPAPGIALRDVRAMLMPPDVRLDRPASPLFAQIDASTGAFAMQHVPSGSYSFQVVGPKGAAFAIRDGIEVPLNGTVDLGRIALGTGRLVVRATFADGRTCEPVRVAVRGRGYEVFVEPPASPEAGVELPEADYLVLVWGEAIGPVFQEATVRNAATTEVEVVAQRAAALTLSFHELPPEVELGLLTVRRAESDLLTMAVATQPLTRGFAPGDWELQFDDLRGHRFEARFTIGSDLAPLTVALQPQR